jgi:hypothetical protein
MGRERPPRQHQTRPACAATDGCQAGLGVEIKTQRTVDPVDDLTKQVSQPTGWAQSSTSIAT